MRPPAHSSQFLSFWALIGFAAGLLVHWAGGPLVLAMATAAFLPLGIFLAAAYFPHREPGQELPPPSVELPSPPLKEVFEARDLNRTRRLATNSRELVANVSHELKTPLTAIRGAAETLRDGALGEPEAAARFTARILEHCQRLETLLGDLLTLSHLEGASQETRHRSFDLGTLAGEALELLRPMAAQRQVRLDLAKTGELQIVGDADAVQRMLINLLQNGINYNRPQGEVRLTLEGSPGQIQIQLEDTGIGIPKAALERIFERFYRVDKGRSRDQGGTGLGLAIVKHVVRSHGGRVRVASELGRGTTFHISLPKGEAP